MAFQPCLGFLLFTRHKSPWGGGSHKNYPKQDSCCRPLEADGSFPNNSFLPHALRVGCVRVRWEQAAGKSELSHSAVVSALYDGKEPMGCGQRNTEETLPSNHTACPLLSSRTVLLWQNSQKAASEMQVYTHPSLSQTLRCEAPAGPSLDIALSLSPTKPHPPGRL